MAKRTKKVKKHTTKHIGKAIKSSIKKLRAIRPDATAAQKKQIDLNIRALNTSYASLIRACKDIWIVPK